MPRSFSPAQVDGRIEAPVRAQTSIITGNSLGQKGATPARLLGHVGLLPLERLGRRRRQAPGRQVGPHDLPPPVLQHLLHPPAGHLRLVAHLGPEISGSGTAMAGRSSLPGRTAASAGRDLFDGRIAGRPGRKAGPTAGSLIEPMEPLQLPGEVTRDEHHRVVVARLGRPQRLLLPRSPRSATSFTRSRPTCSALESQRRGEAVLVDQPRRRRQMLATNTATLTGCSCMNSNCRKLIPNSG